MGPLACLRRARACLSVRAVSTAAVGAIAATLMSCGGRVLVAEAGGDAGIPPGTDVGSDSGGPVSDALADAKPPGETEAGEVGAPSQDVSPPPQGDAETGPPVETGLPGDAGPTTTIVTGVSPVALVADDTSVYWMDQKGGVYQCPVTGCPGAAPTQLATNGAGTTLTTESIAVSGSTVYFVDYFSGGLDDCAAGGCALSPTALVGGGAVYDYLSVIGDAANVYFNGATGLYQCPALATCAAPQTLATLSATYDYSPAFGALAASATEIYFSSIASGAAYIAAVPIGGGATRTVCTPGKSFWFVSSLVYAGAYVYFIDGTDPTHIFECPSFGGGSPSVYFTDVAPAVLATDGADLFWTNDTASGSVEHCALGDTCASATTLAAGQSDPNTVALNTKRVFWSTKGAIYSTLK